MNLEDFPQEIFISLAIYCSLTLGLLFTLKCMRSYYVLRGWRAANNFSPTGEDISPFSQRLVRTHANCFENLPIFLGILILAAFKNQLHQISELALVFIGCRITQSLIHLSSTSNMAVLIRFHFAMAQTLIQIYWVYLLMI